MTYTLFIWTVIACSNSAYCKYDWRPIGEFYSVPILSIKADSNTGSKALCEDAARQMGMKAENYRCIMSNRSK